MGQVLAVQELLCLLCLHDQAAKMFSSSKSAVQESTQEKKGFLACGQTGAGSTASAHSGNALHPTNTHLYTQAGPNGNYRGRQTRGQPHRDVVGLC